MTTDSADTTVPPEQIVGRLARGETLIWWDRPIPALAARRELQIGLLFGLFFLGFAIFWMLTAAQKPGFFFLFGLPFVGIGGWIVSAPARAYFNASRTLYALTDRCALILTDGTMQTFPLEEIDFVETESDPDGSGHVLFYKDAPSFGSWRPTGSAPMPTKLGFVAVRDADQVGRALLEAREKRRSGRTAAAAPLPA
jgi:hypothetical protein